MEPVIWLLAVAALLIIEAITVGLTTIWFAGGCLAAAVAAWFQADLVVQLLLFFGVSVLLLVFTRPLAVKYMRKGVTKTNAESLVGQTAVVIQSICNLEQTGQVRIHDIEWMARTEDGGKTIPEGAVVKILRIDGVKLIVEEQKEG